MRHSRIQRRAMREERDHWPKALQTHFGQCAKCRDFMARDRVVRRLLALKKYEKPDPAMSVRLGQRLRAAAVADPAAPPPWRGAVFHPLRYALAASLAALAGILLYTPWSWRTAQEADTPGGAWTAGSLVTVDTPAEGMPTVSVHRIEKESVPSRHPLPFVQPERDATYIHMVDFEP